MPDQASPQKPEIPQPRPDTIRLDHRDDAGFGSPEVPRPPSPRREANQEEP